MDYIGIKDKMTSFLKKNKYVILVLIAGIILMLLPSQKTAKEKLAEPSIPEQNENHNFSQELTEILSKIDGAGKVEVLLTISAGEETIYQRDESVSGSESDKFSNETILITDANRGQSGLIQQILPPKYQGAIIVCQGANKASVRLSIIEAVSKVTGLGSDKISVLKMK